MDRKLHWYCFSYKGTETGSGKLVNACTYVGYLNKGITLKIINDNKANALVTSDSVLMAATYLGYMTKKRFISSD